MSDQAKLAGLRWLTTAAAAEYLGCTVSFLVNDRYMRRHGIPYSKVGRNIVRYDRQDLDAFMAARKVQ